MSNPGMLRDRIMGWRLSDDQFASRTQTNLHVFSIPAVVFFDITADGAPLGRIEMTLRADVVPKTAENFRCLW
jgi:hypothetical protein